MKALSLTQPWAWSMVHGPKRIENRSWDASYMVGETFAVHASAKYDRDGEAFLLEQGVLVPPVHMLAKSAIIGVTTMVRCVRRAAYDLMYEGRRRELVPADQERFFFGEYGQVWENVRPITPILYPGSLGFFELAEDVAREVVSRLGEKADWLPTPMLPQQGMPWQPPGGLRRRRGGRR